MPCANLVIPKGYQTPLNIMQTEIAIKVIKDTFERDLARFLNLVRVSAPLFVQPDSGLNDNLNGVERPVQFDIKDMNVEVQIIHSLAKWKRLALYRYGFQQEHGLYTDMNAIRRDEILDNLHSVYVDQWDWERTLIREERNPDYLKSVVEKIVSALCDTERKLHQQFPQIQPFLESKVHFLTTQELEDLYPDLAPNKRENKICEQYGTVFLMQIGGLLKSGVKHDGRAPDYDDWDLNGDLLVWNPVLERAFEISSMGIRVDAEALERQLTISGCEDRKSLPFHKMLLNNELPLTIGGGIGQSRICMLMLRKAHIGEVQASVWPRQMIEECEAAGIHLL